MKIRPIVSMFGLTLGLLGSSAPGCGDSDPDPGGDETGSESMDATSPTGDSDTDNSATDTDNSATATDNSATDTDNSATDTDNSATDTDNSATDTDNSATDTDPTESTTGDGDGDGDGQWLLVADDAMTEGSDTFDLEITDEGAFYLVYGRASDQELYAKRSDDGGASWGSAAQVTNGEVWLHELKDKPYIIEAQGEVHVTVKNAFPTFFSSAAGANLSFGGPTIINTDTGNQWKHFPQLGVRDDGEKLVTWVEVGPDPTYVKDIYFARESNGFVAEKLNTLMTPCDCCQANLLMTNAGAAMYGYRTEYSDGGVPKRDAAVLTSLDGETTYTDERQISDSNWHLAQCPQQGVHLAEGGGAIYSTWADTTAGEYTVWLSKTTDGGQNWSSDVQITPSLVASVPYVAADESGKVWVVMSGPVETYVSLSEDSGASFGNPWPLVSPEGTLTDPNVESRGGETAMIGQAADTGNLWIYRP